MTEQNSEETIASFFRMLDFYDKEIEEKLQKKDEVMRILAKAAGKTFMHEGQIYQICERYNKERGCKVPFFKRLPEWPKSWLDKEARAQRDVPGDVVDPWESAQVDVTESLGGDVPYSDQTAVVID